MFDFPEVAVWAPIELGALGSNLSSVIFSLASLDPNARIDLSPFNNYR